MDAGRLVDGAKGEMWETVLKKDKRGYVPPGVIDWAPGPAPIQYLEDKEQPHFAGIGMDRAIKVQGGRDIELRERSRVYLDEVKGSYGQTGLLSTVGTFCNIILLTDRRLLLFVGRPNGDIVVEFGYDERAPPGGSHPTFDADTGSIRADGLEYRLQFWPPEKRDAVEFLRKRFEENTVPPGRTEESRGQSPVQCQGGEIEERTEPEESQEDSAENSDRVRGQGISGEEAIERIEDVINTELNDVEKIVSTDLDRADRWLNVQSRWKSLRTIEKTPQTSVSVRRIQGIGNKLAKNLQNNNFESLQDIRRASTSDLTEVEGIAEETAQRIQNQAWRRPLAQIENIGPVLETRLRENGYRHGGDLSCASLSELTEVEGLGRTRAKKIQARAASWLPNQNHKIPIERICSPPPFDSVEAAEKETDELEKVLQDPLSDQLAALLEQLESLTPSEIEIEEVVLDACLRSSDEAEDQSFVSERWLKVGQRIVEQMEIREDHSPPDEVKSRFEESVLAIPPINPSEILTATLSDAKKQIARIEETITARKRFVSLASEAAELHETLNGSDLKGVDRLQNAISVQILHAKSIVTEGEDESKPERIGRFILISKKSIHDARAYPDFPFEETIVALAELGNSENMDGSTLSDIEEITSVAREAISRLKSLEYDHPAIDQEFWRESIEIALIEQYPPSLTPIKKQLERLRDGLWRELDLHEYNWREFEELIGDLYRDEGYEIDVTRTSADLGVDIWAYERQETIAIQVKQFRKGGTVGRETLQKLVSTLAKGDADRATVVTSGEFAETARQYAQDFGDGLELVGPNELVRRLSESSIPPQDEGV